MPATASRRTLQVRLKRPHLEQRRFLRSTAKRRVVRAGRRGGKTVGVAIFAVEQFLEGKRVLYAVPTSDQMQRFWSEVKLALTEPLAAGIYKKNETDHTIELVGTEQRIKAKTAWNADSLRGDYASILILDEYQLMNEDAWGVVGAPMMLDTNGDTIFIYTPPSYRTAGVTKAHDPRHAAKLYKQAALDTTGRWAVFHFSSHDNPYLSQEALTDITLDMSALAYQQEILALDIENVPGALWTHALLEETRVTEAPVDFVRVCIALDPAASSQATSDEMGIVAVAKGLNGHGYTLRDASMRGTPMACARQAIFLYDELGADVLVAEANNGGEWIGTVMTLVARDMHTKGERTTPHLNYKMVHASRGKQTRAEPVSALFERHMAHMVGRLPELEEQLCSWVPGMPSPDHSDAMTWAYHELLLGTGAPMQTRRYRT